MGKGRKILLIDDEPDYCKVLSGRLESDGYEVTAVGTGQEGIDVASKEPFDLILLDMVMPNKDGVTTYQELRAHANTRDIPVILLTATARQGYWAPFPHESEGRAYILGKPYDHATLARRIDELLSSSGGGEKNGKA